MEWFDSFSQAVKGVLGSYAETQNDPWGLLILFACAAIEYVFPPFPGDTVTLFGAVLVGKWGWSFPIVFAAVTLGSTVGAALDYALGVKLHSWREGKDSRADRRVERILEGFRRWGIWLIAANRFFPGIRAFFFVAAGMAGYSFLPVVGLALVSAIAWNLLIVGAGVYVGAEFDTIRTVVGRYQTVVWILIILAVVAGLVVWLKRRRKAA